MPISLDLADLAIVGAIDSGLDDMPVHYGSVRVMNVPYVAYHPVSSSNNEPGLGDPTRQEEFMFQVRCVGVDAQQARWLSSKVREILLGRSGSGYTTAIEGFNAYGREANPGALQDGGAGIEYCTDTYTFKLEAAS